MRLIKLILNRIRGEQSLNKLIKRGLKVGSNFTRMSGCIIDPSHCWHIEIGNDVILAPNVHILAHDASTKIFLNFTRVANVKIGDRVFIGAASIILPGVSIGNDVVIGAGSVVTRNIPANSLVVGSPAKVISQLDKYLNNEKLKMNSENVFNKDFTLRNSLFTEDQKKILIESCNKWGEAFIE
ncbi:MAG TPA: DapH/DapD/GlmU-related protein [Candidatus Paceibacterota bacterium]